MNNYMRYYKTLLRGQTSSPQGMEVHERLNMVFSYPPGMVVRRPHDNPTLGFVEGLMDIAGIFDQKYIEKVAPNAKLELFTGQSTYGPQIGTQLYQVVADLKNDRYSRRAEIVIADSSDARFDLPCTTSLQFQIRNNELYTTVNMRSSDAVWGLPYDMIQFAMLTFVVESCTQSHAMMTLVNLANAHVYEATKLSEDGGRNGSWDDKWSFHIPTFISVAEASAWAENTLSNVLATLTPIAYLYRQFDLMKHV